MVSKKAREKVGNVIARKERKGKKKNFRRESPRTFIDLAIWLYRDLIKRDRRLFFSSSAIEGRLQLEGGMDNRHSTV